MLSWTPPRATLLAPGSAFGVENHLRIALGQHPEIFEPPCPPTARCFDRVARGPN